MEKVHNKTKVLLFTTLPEDPMKVGGGVEAASVNLLHGLAHSPDVLVCCVSTWRKGYIRRTSFAGNVELVYIPQKWPAFIDYFVSRHLSGLIREFAPDVIHVQGIAPHLIRFRATEKDKILVTAHGIMKKEFHHVRGSKRIKFLFKTVVESYYIRSLRNLIFVSEYNLKISGRTPGDRTRVIPNAINPIFYRDSPADLPADKLVCVGWISHLKNTLLLIATLNDLRKTGLRLHLSVVGLFKETAYKLKVQDYVKKHGMEDQVTFCGLLGQNELRNLLSRSGILVLPSRQENLPVSIAEAMAMGLVVIASDVGGVGEMITDGESGFIFPADDRHSLAAIVKNINEGAVDMASISANARKAAERYQPGQVARETIDYYKWIKKNQNPGSR